MKDLNRIIVVLVEKSEQLSGSQRNYTKNLLLLASGVPTFHSPTYTH